MFPAVVGVAVSKRSSRSISMGNLAGRRSCQGHMYSPSGWLLPVRHTLSLEHNSTSCDPNTGIAHTRWNDIILHYWPFFFSDLFFGCFCIHSVYEQVFWKGCLPGSQGNLCKVCMGGTGDTATKRCADNHNERYYGNMGALRYFFYIFARIMTKRFCIFMISFLDKNVRETPWVIQIFVVCFNPL